MSWITITAITLVLAFACFFGLCEWLARHRRPGDGDDPAAG
ncbi:MAG TPA: hypothetical protein VI168_08565 [Croceibacterium sp.]